MKTNDPSAEDLATEILENNKDISPLFENIVDKICKLRECGLNDDQIRDAIPGMCRIQEKIAGSGTLEEPPSDEIRVISLPRKYQRNDWR